MKFEKPGAKGLAIILFVSFFIIDSLFIEPYKLQTTRSDFDLFGGGANAGRVRIVFISDIHIGLQRGGYLDEVVREIKAHEPDIVLIGGDSIEASESELAGLEPLRNLSATHGVFAVLGNHDYGIYGGLSGSDPVLGNKVESKLESLGIDVLRNENRTLDVRGKRFALVGLDDAWALKNNYSEAASGLDDAMPKVVLTHNQGAVDAAEIRGRSVVLSGHTHCGQVRIPMITDILLGSGFGKTVGGYERLDSDTEAYVTCGITSGFVRFLTNPEISAIDIE